jgi:hypothetical protein
MVEMGLVSLLEIDLKELVVSIEKKCGLKLPRSVIEVYLDKDHDTLFIRFKESERVELGKPLQTKTPATLFTEEETNEITALEIVGVSELSK